MIPHIDVRKCLRDLTAIHGVSGAEHEIVRYLVQELTPLVDSVDVDNWGNIIATKLGNDEDAPTIMIGAHSDEIGFYVKAIDASGFLRVEPVGGVPIQFMPGRPVDVGGVAGVIGSPAWHLGKAQDGPLFVDVGAQDRDDALHLGVHVGSPVAVIGEARDMGPHRMAGKGMDNRTACTVLVGLFGALPSGLVPTVVGVVTVQEEVGLRGARMVADHIPASAAISVDIMPAGDTPDCDGVTDSTVKLGGGPVISIFDQIEEAFAASLIGLISHPRLNQYLFDVARDQEIIVQPNVLIGGGADAAAFHLARGGVPATQVSIPTRYTHTMVETVDMRDLEATIQLLSAFLLSLDSSTSFEFL